MLDVGKRRDRQSDARARDGLDGRARAQILIARGNPAATKQMSRSPKTVARFQNGWFISERGVK